MDRKYSFKVQMRGIRAQARRRAAGSVIMAASRLRQDGMTKAELSEIIEEIQNLSEEQGAFSKAQKEELSRDNARRRVHLSNGPIMEAGGRRRSGGWKWKQGWNGLLISGMLGAGGILMISGGTAAIPGTDTVMQQRLQRAQKKGVLHREPESETESEQRTENTGDERSRSCD
ncbi:MAG: hypothetical protein ACLTSZ_09010 [Lachnospiraceae bacterium]